MTAGLPMNCRITSCAAAWRSIASTTCDERYDDENQRAYWREVRQRDEALLQRRLLRERRQRQAELASQYEDDQYDIELGEEYDPSQQQDDVYAAEVDDEELEDVLVARAAPEN